MKNFVINLDKRVDRWAWAREHFHDKGIQITRFSGIPAKPGWKGCRDSHLALLEKNKSEVAFGIFEDDCEFIGDPSLLEVAIRELPSDWDCLYLGASPQEPQERYSDHLFRLKNAWCTHAIIWHTREGGAVEYILKNREKINKFDVFLSQEVFPNFNCFLIYPLLCTQYQSQSDCCSHSDLSTIVKNYNKYCNG